jgi:ATP-dependent DNA helicase RecG
MPACIDKLNRFLRLESERGYDNRAVVGGLDKFIPAWQKESFSENIDSALCESVLHFLMDYASQNPDSRSLSIQSILVDLKPYFSTSTPPVRHSRPLQKQAKDDHLPDNIEPEKTNHTDSHLQRYKEQPPKAVLPRETQEIQGITAPLTVLPGIGPKIAQTLQSLGLITLYDLLYYFPRRYDDYSQLKSMNRLVFGEDVTVIGTVQSSSSRPIRGGQFSLIEVVVSDGTGFLRLTWFNQPWIANRLTPGIQIVISGKVEAYLGRMVMKNPDWELVEQEHLHTNRIVPVYPLSTRITQKWLRKMLYQTVSYWAPRIQDFLPADIRQAADLLSLPSALQQVHFPDSTATLKSARNRLAFDEIFLLQLGVLRQKRTWQSGTGRVFTAEESWLDEKVHQLPFPLTNAQMRVLGEIRHDLASGHPMDRLIQGDVGSGKTVMAAMAAAIVAYTGSQVAIMAPTTILAEQHYRSFTNLLTNPSSDSEGALRPEEVRFLISDTNEAEKRNILSGLEDGTIKIVIGTQALIEDPIQFKDLQLLVIDEQHRFGVTQRSTLRSKGQNPHLLVMTATPIPRSLALTVYGDLDLSVIDEMPAGRQPVETHLLIPLERERAYQLIRSQVAEGRQAFIICPLVEQGENEESKAAVEEHKRLQTEVFPKLKLGLLHGRLKPNEKDEVMMKFRAGEYHILVSTSVVEVGVDIPNATVMLVEGADRFGLAQLHQFRGRVGRGGAKSYCLLIPETDSAVENERLIAMAETNDGFILAERDLDQRGPGDFLGTRQSGFSELRMASLSDIHLIEKARRYAQALFETDPELTNSEHRPLLRAFQQFWTPGRGDIS